jgi:hypothetical protein
MVSLLLCSCVLGCCGLVRRLQPRSNSSHRHHHDDGAPILDHHYRLGAGEVDQPAEAVLGALGYHPVNPDPPTDGLIGADGIDDALGLVGGVEMHQRHLHRLAVGGQRAVQPAPVGSGFR